MFDYGTHLPALLTAANAIRGRIVEFGAGMFSTSVLRLCFPDRKIVSFETNLEWFQKLRGMLNDNDNHAVVFVDDYTKVLDGLEIPGVVFIDCDPVGLRVELLEWFAQKALCVVVHDSERLIGSVARKLYTTCLEYRGQQPWTMIGSNYCRPEVFQEVVDMSAGR